MATAVPPAAAPTSRASFIVRNVTSSWAVLLVNTLISFLLAPLVVRSLGSVYYGVWSLLMQFTGYLWLFDFGVRESVIKYVAQYEASGERDKLEITVRTAIAVYSLVTLVAMLAVAAMVAALPHVFNIPPDAVSTARIAAFVTGTTVAQSFLTNVFVGVLMGLQRIYLVSRMGIVFSLARAAGTYLLLTNGFGLVGLSLLHLALSLANAGLVVHYCRHYLPDLPLAPTRPERPEVMKLFNYGKYVLLANVGDKIVFATDALVIGAFLPIAALTPYAIAGTLIQNMRQVVMAMAQIFNPLTSSLRAEGGARVVQPVLQSGARAAMTIGVPICIGFITLGERFVSLWMGDEHAAMAGRVMTVLSAGYLVGLPYYTISGRPLRSGRTPCRGRAADRGRGDQSSLQHRAHQSRRSRRGGNRHGHPPRRHRRLGAAAGTPETVPDEPARLLPRRLRPHAVGGGAVRRRHLAHRHRGQAGDAGELPGLGRGQPGGVCRPGVVHLDDRRRTRPPAPNGRRPQARQSGRACLGRRSEGARRVTPPSSPVRILYCESNTDGTIGGSHYCLLWLLENLDRAAFTPTVVFYERHALIPRFSAAAETLVLPPRDPVTWGAGSAAWWSVPAGLLRRSVNSLKFVTRVLGRAWFLKRRGIALVHQNNSIKRHHDWMFAALLVGVPYVAHERGVNRRYSWLDKYLGRRAALIVPVSQCIMGFLLRGGVSPDNMHVLYDGLDPARVTPARTPDTLRREYGLRPEQPVVGIVGNIRAWKGQETVVRAFIDVLKVRPDAICVFVGATAPADQAYRDSLDRIIADAGIGDSVRFTGYQSDPASFVNLMSVVVHASIEPEPFGMVVLEAMAQRKPVVGSRAGGVVEMVVEGATGLTFPPGNASELAARLTTLLSDPARATRMGEAGYARLLDAFSVRQYMDGIHTAYRAILGGRPVPEELGIVPASSSELFTAVPPL